MPFSHFSYRWLKQQNYTYQKARCCYLTATIIYGAIFAILGTIFIILYFNQVNYLNNFNCSICSSYGYSLNCGYLTCCQPGTFFSVSYQYCLGDYADGIYFILFICFYCYAAYEIFVLICVMCRGSYFTNYNNNVIVIDNNPQQYTMPLNSYGNYQQPYAQNPNYPQQNMNAQFVQQNNAQFAAQQNMNMNNPQTRPNQAAPVM